MPWNDPVKDIYRKLRVQRDLFLVGLILTVDWYGRLLRGVVFNHLDRGDAVFQPQAESVSLPLNRWRVVKARGVVGYQPIAQANDVRVSHASNCQPHG